MQTSYTRSPAILLLLVSLHIFGLSAISQQASQDRILAPFAAARIVVLPGSEHPLARAKFDRGPVDPGMQLHGMSLEFGRTPEQQAELTALLHEQQDPASAGYRQWLSTGQFADRFGMTQPDIDKSTAWLRSQGFTVDRVAESRAILWFSGSAGSVESAFHTSIHRYLVEEEMHFANAAPVSLPGAFAGSILRVGGLDDFKPKSYLVHPAPETGSGPRADFTSGQSGSHFVAPGDFAAIYGLASLYSAGFKGSGQTIGVIGQTAIVQADITDFRAAAGLPAYASSGSGPVFTYFPVPTFTAPALSYSDLDEADLDIEWSGGVAPNANVIFIASRGGVFSALEYAIANKINGLQVPILTLSYGSCEANFSSAQWSSLDAQLQEANAQGQTLINSSGDSGAAGCDQASTPIKSATRGLAVSYPASSAYVTALGGSEFMGDGTAANPATGADQYWNATGSSDVLTSAVSYIPEMAWNDSTFSIGLGGGLSSGGGGASTLFAKPAWQSGVPGIPNDGRRDVPDVSLNASPDHDGYLFCTQTVLASNTQTGVHSSSCANGFRVSDPEFSDNGGLAVVGGTSASAPAFAGILAAIEQKLGTSLGNINPTLYLLASNANTYAAAFHDIASGSNEVPCTAATADCASSGVLGYAAGIGYDQATGLGSIDGSSLATAFATGAAKSGTTTTLAVSPSAPAIGASVTLTATVSPSSASGTPTGAVTFTLNGSAGNPVTLSGGTASTATSFSTAGTQTVSAAYSGDTNYDASSGTSTITVSTTGAAGSALQLIPISPCRVVDTRASSGAFGGPELATGSSREFDLPLSGCSIPGNAVAYSLNVTAVPDGKLSYLTLWPSGQAQPNVSTLNSDGRVKANAAITPAGNNGGVSVFASDSTNVILDINGYFVPAGSASALAYYAVTPCRVADTRNPAGPLAGPLVSAGVSRDFPVLSSACGLPASAQAYSLNVTAVPHSTLNYLTLWPASEIQPNASTLNSPTGTVVANAAIVAAGQAGSVSIFASGDTDVILDVNGYFAAPATGGLSLYTVTPCRALDTRSGSGPVNGVAAVAIQSSGCMPPSAAQAYILNATVVPSGPLPYLTLWPATQAQPGVSTLNAYDGATTSNLAIVASSNGSVEAFAAGPTQLILDLAGYFAP